MVCSLCFKFLQALIFIIILIDDETSANETNHCSGIARSAMEKIAEYFLKFKREKCIDNGIESGKMVWGHLHEIFVADGYVDEAMVSVYQNEYKKNISRMTCL
jgi:hypothetical protein